ncbi:MAG: adenosylcobinamide-GDP ribazoletransferase [Chloroflexi bacterium]|nr:MAG: adenosylcobinamide-GDP ribazoletransferase [Chloroflexota bacterium]
MKGLQLALSFFSTLPSFSKRYVYDAAHWRTAVYWFPVVGAILGGLVWLVGWGAGFLFSSWLTAVITIAVWAGLTGGLHLDGLIDCSDGLLASVSPERRLEIMRDPRVGAFGAFVLVLFLCLKIGAVQRVLTTGFGGAIPIAAALGRTATIWIAKYPSARPGGMGEIFSAQIDRWGIFTATVLPVMGLLFFGWRGVWASLVTIIVILSVGRFARQRVGGVTGDVFGLCVELVELGVLLTFAVQWQGQ